MTPRIDQPAVNRLTAQFYEAASDGLGWNGVMHAMTTALRVPIACMLRMGASPDSMMWASHNLAPESGRLYNDTYAAMDPWAGALRAQGGFAPGALSTFLGESLVPDRELRRTPYFNEFGRYHDSGGCAAIVAISRDGHTAGVLTLCRPARSRPFHPSLIAPLAALGPHLRRALRLQDVWSTRHGSRAERAVLDQRPDRLFVVSKTGRVLWCNLAAHNLLSAGTLVTLRGRQLAGIHPRTDDAIRRLLRTAASVLSSDSSLAEPPAAAVLWSTRGVKSSAWAAPLPASGNGDFSSSPGRSHESTILLSVSPDPRDLQDLYCRAFNLTPTEARIAAQLTTADDRRTRSDRIRWHLRQIFRKTGATHQADLVRRLHAVQRDIR